MSATRTGPNSAPSWEWIVRLTIGADNGPAGTCAVDVAWAGTEPSTDEALKYALGHLAVRVSSVAQDSKLMTRRGDDLGASGESAYSSQTRRSTEHPRSAGHPGHAAHREAVRRAW
jgi:hypothetical protein